MAWIIAHPIIAYRVCRVALGKIGITIGHFLTRPVWPAISGCMAMAIAVIGTRYATPNSWPGLARLICEILVGGSAYIGALFVLHRDRIESLKGVIATVRGSRS